MTDKAGVKLATEKRSPARWRTVFDSLLAEILLWLLIILMMAWSLGVIMIYNVTGRFANEPYDVVLTDNARAIAKLVGFDAGRITVNLPMPARELLRTDAQDQIYFQVSDADGTLLVGDAEVPWLSLSEVPRTNQVFLRDDEMGDEEVRVAYLYKTLSPQRPPVLVQVAETRNKRTGMAARIVSSVIVPQFAIFPLSVLLIYFAVSRGITPLHRLQDELRSRRSTDLSAISLEGIPLEIRPLVSAFNATLQRLDDSLAVQRRFVADAAHQLKTPLTGLRVQAELAASENEADVMRGSVQHMLQSIERLSDMTQKLLTLARTESLGEAQAQFLDVDLAALVPDVARTAATQAIPRDIVLSFDGQEGGPLVQGNAVLLFELFANLLDNAIRYTPDGGAIHIVLGVVSGQAYVDIEDNGRGIPPELRDKVFDRFYRVLGTQVEGSGLGLSIVREIADLHHAVVSLHDGAEGRGTRVRVLFPLA